MIQIITPCSRPENLIFMKDSVPTECNWTIVYDNSVKEKLEIEGATILHSPYTGSSGNPNRNYALDTIEFSDTDWIYILDDDNIIHPEWYDRVKDFTDEHLNMIAWGQVWKNNTVRLAATNNPNVGTIDTSCYMVRGRVMKTLRYQMDYVADGIMAREAYEQGGFMMLDEYLGYYNYLRTPTDRDLTP
jgi:hypothetical protein